MPVDHFILQVPYSWFFRGTYIPQMPNFQLFCDFIFTNGLPNGIAIFGPIFHFAYFFEHFNFTNLPISAKFVEFKYLKKYHGMYVTFPNYMDMYVIPISSQN